ncbi:hypothetical protein GCK32_011442 [Trichostrongylus colubriformis]|uniref:SCP domain-containing protein n=1 Tax=Trichostrongylus colubriformis TaxID=6319 RepID=A0AAN8ETC4_TRICO
MLLGPGVLFVLLIAAGAQEQECKVRHLRIECHLAGWLKILYEEFFEEYKQRNPKDPQGLIWNVTMSDLAQREAKVRGSIVKKDQPFFDNGTPYIMLQNAKAFWKADNLTVKEKVTRTIRKPAPIEMLFAPAVLSVLLVIVEAQEQDCIARGTRVECHLSKWLKELYVDFFKKYKQRIPTDPQTLIWNETMSDLAQREAKVRGSIVKKDQPFFDNGTPYIMLQNAKAFFKSDHLSVKEKVNKTISSNTFIGWADYGKVNRLSYGTQFGCNGYGGFERLDKEYMNVVCFFEKGWQ